MQIPIMEINIRDGRRRMETGHIKKLADSIRELGLLNPLTVDKENTLIAGLHRLEAVKQLGWTEVECTVSSLKGLQAELAEYDAFVQKFHREIGWYNNPYYDTVYPSLSEEQLVSLRNMTDAICSAAGALFEKVAQMRKS